MNSIAFAKHLFLLRRDHHMTVEDLASAMEITPELVCEWECAKKSPTLDQINRLSKIYGMPVSDVIQSPKPARPAPVPEEPEPEAQPEVEKSEEAKKESAEEYTLKRGRKKKKPAAWEILIIVLLLLIIAASLTFLIKPEWFPFLQYLGS